MLTTTSSLSLTDNWGGIKRWKTSNETQGEGEAEAEESWNASKTSARAEHRERGGHWVPGYQPRLGHVVLYPGLSLRVPRCLNIQVFSLGYRAQSTPVPTPFSWIYAPDCSFFNIRDSWSHQWGVRLPASQNPTSHCTPNSNPPRRSVCPALLCTDVLLGVSQSLFLVVIGQVLDVSSV